MFDFSPIAPFLSRCATPEIGIALVAGAALPLFYQVIARAFRAIRSVVTRADLTPWRLALTCLLGCGGLGAGIGAWADWCQLPDRWDETAGLTSLDRQVLQFLGTTGNRDQMDALTKYIEHTKDTPRPGEDRIPPPPESPSRTPSLIPAFATIGTALGLLLVTFVGGADYYQKRERSR